MSANLSRLSDDDTARTDPECAAQRAEHLAALGARSVLELCVGPSLWTMEEAYARHGIRCAGNDLDARWARYHPSGTWLIGDALRVDWSGFDAVVFAPPVTRGCTGRREDALRIDEVVPTYRGFVARPWSGIRVMVLPARSIATREDRTEYHALLAEIGEPHEAIPLRAERRRIRKYVDVYYATKEKR